MFTFMIRSYRFIAIALLAAAAAGCSKSETAQARGSEADAKPVQVEAVRQNSVRRSVDVVGTLAAVDQVTISSEADGTVSRSSRISAIACKAGQVLVELDSEKQQYTFEQQQAALARALAQYGATDPEHLPDDREDARRAESAKAELVQAKQAFERANELFKRTLISQQALDDAKATLQSKQAGYDSALQSAKNLRASIQASEATMKLAERQLRDTEIRAPFDGYVEKRLVNLGELVKAQMPVMAVVRLDPLKVTAEIPEKMAPWISDRPGRWSCTSTPIRDRTFTGKVTRISPAVNTATRAFPFEALVPNADARAQAGHLRARARRERQGGRRADAALRGAPVPLRRQPRLRRRRRRLAMRELQVGERLGDRIEIAERREGGRAGGRHRRRQAGRRRLVVGAIAGNYESWSPRAV